MKRKYSVLEFFLWLFENDPTFRKNFRYNVDNLHEMWENFVTIHKGEKFPLKIWLVKMWLG